MPLSHDAANKISGSLTIRLVLFVFKIEDMQKFATKKNIIFALLFVLKGQHIPENIYITEGKNQSNSCFERKKSI